MTLLRRELEIQKSELLETLHFASLEKIFIEERIYKDREFEEAKTVEIACAHIGKRLQPFCSQFLRAVTNDDILKLLEIKMQRILKFNIDKANEFIASLNKQLKEIDQKLNHIVDYTIEWFDMLKEKYGTKYPRHTEIKNFDTIEATKVAEANLRLYINREEGFIGTGLKKDEFVSMCSDIDDAIIFFKNGRYKVIRITDKVFVGKNILHLAVFKKDDSRTIYNAVYRDGKSGNYYIKRFNVTSVTRDREYDLTQGTEGSKVVYFTANPNGEAETIKITLKPTPKLKKIIFDKDFRDIMIKGRQSMGNLLTKNDIYRIALKQRGGSTLGGRKVWFDPDVLRLNYDERGEYLGEFQSDDQILVVYDNGNFYTTDFDLNNHFEPNIARIEKFDESKVWSAVLYDADQHNYPYLKRFYFEPTSKLTSYLGENPASRPILLTDVVYPRIQVTFGQGDSFREPLVVDVEEFIGVKSVKAKGKRISTYSIGKIEELEPTRFPEKHQEESTDANPEKADNNEPTGDDNPQLSLF